MIIQGSRYRSFILGLAVLVMLGEAYALDPRKAVTQYGHQTWQTDNGLPQNAVTAILATRDGYLWIGTQGGLARFDGLRFTTFHRGNTEGFKDNFISCLAEDEEGRLWIGTRGGLLQYDEGRFTAFSTAQGLPIDYIRALYVDHNNRLWIGTYGGGLSYLHEDRFHTFTTEDGLSHNLVRAIHEGQDGRLWVGTAEGLNCLEDNEFSSYTFSDSPSANSVRSIYEDRRGVLWIGTNGGGLYRLEEGRFENPERYEELSNDVVWSILEDRDHNLWIGTGDGLKRIDQSGVVSTLRSGSGLSHNLVGPLFEDAEGNLWVGTRMGLDVLRDGKFTMYTTQEGLPDDFIRSVYEDRAGTLWVGTGAGGLARLRRNEFEVLTTREGLAHMEVRSLVEDRDGGLWVGTRQGLTRFSNGSAESYGRAEGLTHEYINVVYVDSRDDLWIGTSGGGLFRRRGNGPVESIVLDDEPTTRVVRCILEDSRGRMWIGTEGGLQKLEGDEIIRYTEEDGLSNDFIFALHEDADGMLWVGTAYGLNCYDNGKIDAFTSQDGLLEEVVFQILEDDQNNLWLSGGRGVSRIGRRQLLEFARDRARKLTPVTYGRVDGLHASECNGGTQPAGWKTRDGRLWFPTVEGLASIEPDRIQINHRSPRVVIEKLTVGDEAFDPVAGHRFPTSRTALEISYTGLSFIAPEKIKFKYRLAGFDEDWIDAGTRREAFYTNIPPGEYVFQVLASNNDGVWSDEGPSFAFVVEPPFYRTSLFYAVTAVLFVMLGVGAHRIRMKRRVARENKLENLVTKRTYQLEEANQALVEMARRDSMTGVANHRHLMERLDEEWRRGIRARTHLSVVMCDIDFFKNYNDRYGHEAGNQCLLMIARALTEALGRPGDLVARYGGDEFVMILSGSDADGARALAETLPDRIQERRISHESSPVADVVTISVGVSTVIPTQEASTGDLISAADAALYEAKNAGRNCVRISEVKVRSSSRDAL